MGISEVERRVGELNALIKCQLRLIRKLEKRGKDLTSAKIVFDSLRVSLFLATQEWNRARCFGERDRTRNDDPSSAWGSKPRLVVVPHERRVARLTGGEASMKAEDHFLDLTDKIGIEEINEQLGPAIVPEMTIEKISASSESNLGFRPLTEEEKREFENSLNADGKRILAELADRVTLSGGSAA
jgi:hypothetical protein